MIFVPAVFGPVRSRRLGISLGVDPLPCKLCSYNCVYCQLGRTRKPSTRRRALQAPGLILDQVEQALSSMPSGGVDWITVVGAGEPTLYQGLGELLRALRDLARARIAVITNGSLLHQPELREELSCADAVLPTLDAGDERTYQAIHRPAPGLTLDRVLDGLIAFRASFQGQLWIETMLVEGVNDSPKALSDIVTALHRVAPHEVHLLLPTRPPSEPWVRAPSIEVIAYASALFKIPPPGQETVDPAPPPRRSDQDPAALLLGILSRHPMTPNELAWTLGISPVTDVLSLLHALEQQGLIQPVERLGRVFWIASWARHGKADHAPPGAPPE